MIIKSTLVEFEELRADPRPGLICFLGSDPSGLAFICPCGCGSEGYLPLKHDPHGPSWEFDGNKEQPTLKPSIQRVGGCKWHGWLRKGDFVTV